VLKCCKRCKRTKTLANRSPTARQPLKGASSQTSIPIYLYINQSKISIYLSKMLALKLGAGTGVAFCVQRGLTIALSECHLSKCHLSKCHLPKCQDQMLSWVCPNPKPEVPSPALNPRKSKALP
jgi:hypothetical protein